MLQFTEIIQIKKLDETQSFFLFSHFAFCDETGAKSSEIIQELSEEAGPSHRHPSDLQGFWEIFEVTCNL